MHQDGPSVSAKTPGRAVAYPLDVITLASHTTADKRRTSPLPGHHHDHTAASRSSSRKLAINSQDAPSSVVRTLTAQLTELKRRHRDEINALKQALEAAHGENLELRRRLGSHRARDDTTTP